MKTNNRMATLLLIAVLTIIPFLCLTEFNSKGEPREAVVALSMLKEGNWILPVNNGGDIPYKPPFFHWLIALFSLIGGKVTEFTSRLPSAVALIATTLGVYAFYRKRGNEHTAFVTALLTLTAFEVHRAGMNCRVDMVLTALIVGALLLLYRWFERGARGVPVWAVLCMSGAACTKGPVGIVLPCLVMGIFMLLRGVRLGRTLLLMICFGLLSLILPALWYVAAWLAAVDTAHASRSHRSTLEKAGDAIAPFPEHGERGTLHLALVRGYLRVLLHSQKQAQRLSAPHLSFHGVAHG